jgi:four helix bundle protein
MQSPKNLRVMAHAMTLARLTYGATDSFPPRERFGLASQMRRAAVSVGSNIAKGCGRESNASLRPFLHYALGSASELQFQVDLARTLEMGRAEQLAELEAALGVTRAMLLRLINRMNPVRRPPAARP